MLNKSYLYGNNHILTITGYRHDEERQRIYIHTNEREDHFDRPDNDVSSFLKQLKPAVVASEKEMPNPGELMIANGNSMATQLSEVLMDNIKKLQTDPGFIKQAQAITNNVNALVNLTKMQLDFHKAAAKYRD